MGRRATQSRKQKKHERAKGAEEHRILKTWRREKLSQRQVSDMVARKRGLGSREDRLRAELAETSSILERARIFVKELGKRTLVEKLYLLEELTAWIVRDIGTTQSKKLYLAKNFAKCRMWYCWEYVRSSPWSESLLLRKTSLLAPRETAGITSDEGLGLQDCNLSKTAPGRSTENIGLESESQRRVSTMQETTPA